MTCSVNNQQKLAWPADSGTGRSDSEIVRTLSDMVVSIEGRKNECMGGSDSGHPMLAATAR